MEFGTKKGLYTIDHIDLIKQARDMGLTPDLPDEKHRGKKWDDVPKDQYPYWFGLGVVYEHGWAWCMNISTRRSLIVVQPRVA